jgi:spermidine/putrescine transport system ATP-binding protein
MSFLRFENIRKSFGEFRAVDDVSISIEKGQVFSLLGPSGCGKTTLLRMAAGFEQPDRGRIFLDGIDITALPPEQRKVNTVFQNYALFPHLNVRENIAFGLKMAKHDKAFIRSEVDRMLELVDLEAQADKSIREISGGQKQRVAIARALVNRPQVLLLDEPLAALDLKLRQRLLVELDAIHDEVGITFLYVTHDQSEAMSISDQIAVMNHGQVQQIGEPHEIYELPRNSFVAAFIGDTNFLSGSVESSLDANTSLVRIDDDIAVIVENDIPLRAGDSVHLSLRPEKIQLGRSEPRDAPHRNALSGLIEDSIYYGSHTRYWVRCGSLKLCAEVQHRKFSLEESLPHWGDTVWIHWQAEDGFLLHSYNAEDESLLTLPEEEISEATP